MRRPTNDGDCPFDRSSISQRFLRRKRFSSATNVSRWCWRALVFSMLSGELASMCAGSNGPRQKWCRANMLDFYHSGLTPTPSGVSDFPARGAMKPAIETPGGVSSDTYQKTVCCLRCEQKLERYQLIRASLAPGNSAHAILSCPRCGHVEFVAESSPLLQSLELISVDTGDGD